MRAPTRSGGHLLKMRTDWHPWAEDQDSLARGPVVLNGARHMMGKEIGRKYILWSLPVEIDRVFIRN
jgi:hypothetical protein